MYSLQTRSSFPELLEAISSGQKNLFVTRFSEEELLHNASHVAHGVFDFDGTLNHRAQWMVMADLMPEPERQEDERDVQWYMSISHEPVTVSSLTDRDWFLASYDRRNRGAIEGALTSRAVSRFMRAGFTKQHVQEAGTRIMLRQGVRELFDLMAHRVMVSYGLEQVIHACLDHHGLEAAVAATRLRFNEAGVLTGYEPNVVVSSSKPAAVERFQTLSQARVDELLIMGDSIGDQEMMKEGALNVLMIPQTESDRYFDQFRQKHLAELWNSVSTILIADELHPLAELLVHARETNSTRKNV